MGSTTARIAKLISSNCCLCLFVTDSKLNDRVIMLAVLIGNYV